MPATQTGHVPKLCYHKATGQAYVRLNGRTFYLGRWDDPAVSEKYQRLVAEWKANGRRIPAGRSTITIAEVCARYVDHARRYYVRPDGSPSSEHGDIKRALVPLRQLYARSRAAEFSPQGLKAVRGRMIEEGLARTVVNQRVKIIRRMFKWAVGEGLVAAEVWHALLAIEGLRKGRSEARETADVKPVPEAHVEAAKRHASPTVAAMIDVQRLTGMRPTELCIMRPCDLDTSGRVWTYTPTEHKTAHHGHRRTVYIGPAAQRALEPFMPADLTAYIFDPRRGHAEGRAASSKGRRRRANQQRTPRTTGRRIRERYDKNSYRRAVIAACDKAGVPRWSPNRLRHNAATYLRREYGIELAQTVLGHRLGSAITEVYAEANVERAKDVIARVG